jgi:hypothetical protein
MVTMRAQAVLIRCQRELYILS